MEELSQITQEFLRGQEMMLRAFNRLLAYRYPKATGLFPVFGVPVAKPEPSA